MSPELEGDEFINFLIEIGLVDDLGDNKIRTNKRFDQVMAAITRDQVPLSRKALKEYAQPN